VLTYLDRRRPRYTLVLGTALGATGPVVVDVHIDPRPGAPTACRHAGLLRDSAPAEHLS
jgi:hypothetical protein